MTKEERYFQYSKLFFILHDVDKVQMNFYNLLVFFCWKGPMFVSQGPLRMINSQLCDD